MDADSADNDGGEHETGNGEANSNSHLASSARRSTASTPHKMVSGIHGRSRSRFPQSPCPNCEPPWKSGRSDADRPSPFPGWNGTSISSTTLQVEGINQALVIEHGPKGIEVQRAQVEHNGDENVPQSVLPPAHAHATSV